MQLKQYLEQNGYTAYEPSNLSVIGDNFDPGQSKQMIATITTYLWLGGMLMAFAGQGVFNFFGIKDPSQLPAWYNYLQQNKTACLAGLFFLNNWGNSQLSTGAFEIYLDGEIIYSKLASGRVPPPEVLVSLLLENGVKQGTQFTSMAL